MKKHRMLAHLNRSRHMLKSLNTMPEIGPPDKFIEGLKFDDGKPRYDLIDAEALHELARLYTFGCKKYAAENWRVGLPWWKTFGAILRHLYKFWRKEDKNDIDPESKVHHMIAAAWGCFTLYWYSQHRKNFDTRL